MKWEASRWKERYTCLTNSNPRPREAPVIKYVAIGEDGMVLLTDTQMIKLNGRKRRGEGGG